jgi:enoyl-CoA hydratase/carnithine racemase
LIATDFTGPVARVTVAHDRKLNTLGSGLLLALAEAFGAVPGTARAVVLTGEGRSAFIGGADITEMARVETPAQGRAFIERVHAACAAIRDCPVPVIARINGWCLGAGLEIAAACDLRIAAETAQFGMPEVRVGIPSVIHAALLPRLVGWGRARWLVMTAENIDAPTALAWGLVDMVANEGGLDAAVEHTVKALLECGPEALRAQKALLRQWEELPLTESVNLSVGVFGKSFLTGEPQRLMQGFLDRKK